MLSPPLWQTGHVLAEARALGAHKFRLPELPG